MARAQEVLLAVFHPLDGLPQGPRDAGGHGGLRVRVRMDRGGPPPTAVPRPGRGGRDSFSARVMVGASRPPPRLGAPPTAPGSPAYFATAVAMGHRLLVCMPSLTPARRNGL